MIHTLSEASATMRIYQISCITVLLNLWRCELSTENTEYVELTGREIAQIVVSVTAASSACATAYVKHLFQVRTFLLFGESLCK